MDHVMMCCLLPLLLLSCITNLVSAQPTVVLPPTNNSSAENITYSVACKVGPADPETQKTVLQLIAEDVKLIHYQFRIGGEDGPARRLDTVGWARVSNLHGQTLLSMKFTHGVMSLMTLTLGQKHLSVVLQDEPPGCMAGLGAGEREERILHLLVRDYSNATAVNIVRPERICREVVVVEGEVAKFRNKCCAKGVGELGYSCWIDLRNMWLTMLHVLLTVVRYATLLYGPYIFVKAIVTLGAGIEILPYKVPCREDRPLEKKIIVYADTLPGNIPQHNHLLDLRKKSGWPKFYRSLQKAQVPLETPVSVSIKQYDIKVTHDKLVTEYHVPVGFWSSVARVCCRCKLNRMGPFKACLQAKMCCGWLWIDLAKKLGAVLMVLLLPLPYYIRLIVYYCFEEEEVERRDEVASSMGLRPSYEHSLIHYLTPTHPLFIIIYAIYVITSLTMGYLLSRNNEQCIRKILFDSFFDFRYFYWTKLWQVFVSNLVFPLKRFGLKGCLLGLLYWPVVMPVTLVICLLYHIPTTYVIYRMIYHSIYGGLRVGTCGGKPQRYKVERQQDTTIDLFRVDNWWCLCKPVKQTITSSGGGGHLKLLGGKRKLARGGKLTKYLGAVILCILNMLGVLLLLSECIGFVVELLTFTMMGVIVNASFLLVYVSFIFLIVIYCYDCFNNVTLSYQKLNRAIFWTLLGKLEYQINEVTGETATKQENTGFIIEDALTRDERPELSREQSQVEEDDESSEEDEDWDWLFKGRDDLDPHDGLRPEAKAGALQKAGCKGKSFWNINDLVLFMDNRDIPRIPRRLFDEVCNIRLHGLPGPLYQSHLNAFKQLIVITIFLVFVFIVIQTFGMVYNITAGNKLIATLVSGFIPMILRNFMSPKAPDVDVRNMNFKTRINQILMNYNQWWPIHDFPFQLPDTAGDARGEAGDTKRSSLSDSIDYEDEQSRGSSEAAGPKGHKPEKHAELLPPLPADGSLSMLEEPELDYVVVVDGSLYDGCEEAGESKV